MPSRNYGDKNRENRPGREAGVLVPTDRELLERVRRGDRAAFGVIVQRHAAGLHRSAWAMMGNTADAQDVVQETLMGAFRGVESFRGEASVRTWLVGILTRQVAHHRRREGYRQTRSLEGADGRATVDRNLTRPGDVAASDARMDLAGFLARLVPEHRDVLVLRELEGLSYDEIAVTLGLPRGTVESRLFRARQALREMAEESGGVGENRESR